MTSQNITENENIMEILKTVIDPEIEINIVDLGLIYEIKHDEANIDIEMTLSTPACPIGDTIIMNVIETVKQRYPQHEVNVNLTFDPPWNPDMITEEGKKMIK
ncbi:MAG: metal-sulfur cluster assembly factor [Deltaproteobacteria bacterium]